MNLKRKRKWVLSLVLTFTMVCSSVGTVAAVEPIESGAQSTEAVDTEPEPTFVVTEEETEEEAEERTEKETEEETGSETEDETGEETEDETESETEEETEEGTEDETESETEEETEDETESETEEETEKETEDETESETVEETEEETEDETESETEEETEEETEDETESETEEETGEKTEDETESETEEETKEETDETESDAEEGTEDETESKTEDETESDTEGETKEDDLLEDSNDETSADLENPDDKPTAALIPDHEHSWSEDWNYDGSCHWHECDAEDCPVTDDSDKDGYAEHNYDEHGVCTDCGFDAMAGIAVAAEMDVDIPTYQEAYEAMTALKDKYPEGMTWTNFEPYGSRGNLGDAYTWKGGAIYGAKSGVGCMAFAFILSDAAFGSLPARAVTNFAFEDVKVGDILRVNGNSHSVIVLQKSAAGVTVAEANFNKSVHWGRAMSASAVEEANFVITRYPEGYVPSDSADADEVDEEGTAGNLKWSLTKAGVLTISGNGAIPDYSSDSLSPWNGKSINTVTIEEGITSIGDYAFYQSGVLSVYIPDSVTAIGQSAFYGSKLLAVTIPGGVKTIGDNAFRNCANLTSASVSEGVEIIGENAFRACTALTHIDFPASITSVGAGAFMSCSEMVSVRFMPGGDVKIGDDLFSQCGKLISVTLPLNADCISNGMFISCTLLPELYIPASVQQIGGEYGVGIYESPFNSCANLKVIYFGGSQTEWNNMMNPVLLSSLKSIGATVVCDAEFEDPFAPDPDDPGDFQPGETEPDVDDDEKDPGDSDDNEKDPSAPDEDEKDPSAPDEDEKDPSAPGEDEKDPSAPDEDEKDPSAPDEDQKDPSAPDEDEKDPSAPDEDEKNPSAPDDDEKNPGSSSGDEKDPSGAGDDKDDSDVGDKDPSGSGDGDNSSKPGGSTGGSTNGPNHISGISGISRPGGSSGSSSSGGSSSTKKRSASSSRTATKTHEDGTRTTITTDSAGKVKMEVNLSASALAAAEESGKAVTLPISAVEVADNVETASAITVYTDKEEPVNVAIPAVSPTAGTVAVIVNEDGSAEVIKNSVPTENSVVAPLPNGATVKIVDNSKSYSDVPEGAWFEDAADFVSARGLFHDTSETAFAPDESVTCADLMTALAGFDGAETDGGATWYEKSAEWAAANGISDGADPNSSVTYEQTVTMLWKYQGSPAAADQTQTGSAQEAAMRWARENGIDSGFEDGSLDSQSQMSRAQAAQMIMNLAKKKTLNSVQ